MEKNISSSLFTLFVLLLGWFLHWLPNYFKEKRDRKDRYFFALLEKRLKINQEAYNFAEKLKNVIHGDEDNRRKVVTEVQE